MHALSFHDFEIIQYSSLAFDQGFQVRIYMIVAIMRNEKFLSVKIEILSKLLKKPWPLPVAVL